MVDNIAATAHIALTEDERQRLAAEFDPIIDSLAVTADEQLPVTVNPLPVNNKVRADVVANELSNEQALSAAPNPKTDNSWYPQSWTENNASYTTDRLRNGGKASLRPSLGCRTRTGAPGCCLDRVCLY